MAIRNPLKSRFLLCQENCKEFVVDDLGTGKNEEERTVLRYRSMHQLITIISKTS